MRAPLTERYRNLKGDSENKESEANLLLEEIKLLRERMKEVADETRLKDDLYKQLVRESGNLSIIKLSLVDEKRFVEREPQSYQSFLPQKSKLTSSPNFTFNMLEIASIKLHICALQHATLILCIITQVGEYERMSKDLSRVAYTRRIMEIVHNIQRQKEDINKILGDTRVVQKEINQLGGKLDRVFTVTDEQVFKDARKDEARRSAYKLLASLREVSIVASSPGPTMSYR